MIDSSGVSAPRSVVELTRVTAWSCVRRLRLGPLRWRYGRCSGDRVRDQVHAPAATTPLPLAWSLDRRLETSVAAGRGFVLVSAPAGSGKSTLVNGWLDRPIDADGWLQVDDGDDDPIRFWSGVAAALQTTVPGIGEAIRTAIGDGSMPWSCGGQHVVSVDGEVVLVIDDYHLICNDDVHGSVERLVSLRPAN